MKRDVQIKIQVYKYERFGYIVLEKLNNSWTITNMYVIPSIRNRGIGKKLFKLAEDTIKAFGNKSISINMYDPEKASFIEKMGYIKKGEYTNSKNTKIFIYKKKFDIEEIKND